MTGGAYFAFYCDRNAHRRNSVEKRELELLKHIETVQEDRQKIVDTIEELDRYKRDALNKTWQKVNEYVVVPRHAILHFRSR